MGKWNIYFYQLTMTPYIKLDSITSNTKACIAWIIYSRDAGFSFVISLCTAFHLNNLINRLLRSKFCRLHYQIAFTTMLFFNEIDYSNTSHHPLSSLFSNIQIKSPLHILFYTNLLSQLRIKIPFDKSTTSFYFQDITDTNLTEKLTIIN